MNYLKLIHKCVRIEFVNIPVHGDTKIVSLYACSCGISDIIFKDDLRIFVILGEWAVLFQNALNEFCRNKNPCVSMRDDAEHGVQLWKLLICVLWYNVTYCSWSIKGRWHFVCLLFTMVFQSSWSISIVLISVKKFLKCIAYPGYRVQRDETETYHNQTVYCDEV